MGGHIQDRVVMMTGGHGALQGRANTTLDPRQANPESVGDLALAPEFIAEGGIHAIDQPRGASLSDITVRATGDHYIL